MIFDNKLLEKQKEYEINKNYIIKLLILIKEAKKSNSVMSEILNLEDKSDEIENEINQIKLNIEIGKSKIDKRDEYSRYQFNDIKPKSI